MAASPRSHVRPGRAYYNRRFRNVFHEFRFCHATTSDEKDSSSAKKGGEAITHLTYLSCEVCFSPRTLSENDHTRQDAAAMDGPTSRTGELKAV